MSSFATFDTIEQAAREATEQIANKYLFFTIPQKNEIKRLLVSKFSPLVQTAQTALTFEDGDAEKQQRSMVLDALKKARSAGVVNVELNRICFRYGARLFELRRMGYSIKTTREAGRVFRFTLAPEGW